MSAKSLILNEGVIVTIYVSAFHCRPQPCIRYPAWLVLSRSLHTFLS
jgi:hypothetical protein